MKIKYDEVREMLFKNDFQGNSLVLRSMMKKVKCGGKIFYK